MPMETTKSAIAQMFVSIMKGTFFGCRQQYTKVHAESVYLH